MADIFPIRKVINSASKASWSRDSVFRRNPGQRSSDGFPSASLSRGKGDDVGQRSFLGEGIQANTERSLR
jgi:hypothetical protein